MAYSVTIIICPALSRDESFVIGVESYLIIPVARKKTFVVRRKEEWAF